MERASLGRVIVTPLILLVAGFLIFGLPGLVVAAGIAVIYLWSQRR